MTTEIRKEAHNWTWAILLFTVIFCTAMITIISPAHATTETFTLTEANSTSYSETLTGSASYTALKQMIINFDTIGTPSDYVYYFEHASGNKNTTESAFTITNGPDTIATGTMYGLNGTFMGGTYTYYMRFHFDTWDSGSYSGYAYYANISFADPAVNLSVPTANKAAAGYLPKYMAMRADVASVYPMKGMHLWYQDSFTQQSWEVTNTTVLSKDMLFDFSVNKVGISKAKIFSNNSVLYTGTQDNLAASGSLTGADLVFQMYSPKTYMYYNTSVLFTNYLNSSGLIPPVVTPTPTPYPTGYARTFVQCVDTGGTNVYHCDISIKDETTGTWSNVTDDLDGAHYIETLTSHTIAAYASADGYADTSRTGLPAKDAVYDLVMIPADEVCSTPGACGTSTDPGDGNVNLVVLVEDSWTGDPISGALVQLVESDGSITSGNTNLAGVAKFMPSNNTFFRVKASADDYQAGSTTTTTSAFGPDSVSLALSPQYTTASPTVTITNSVGEVVTTLDTRSASQKDADMMDQVRDAGPGIIGMGIVFVFLYMIKGLIW